MKLQLYVIFLCRFAHLLNDYWNLPNLTIIPKMSLDPENEFDPGNDRFQPTRFKLQYLVSGRRKEDTGLATRRDRETEV